MKRVLRYPLTSAVWDGDGVAQFDISIPVDSILLHAGVSRGELCVWALVDDQCDPGLRSIVVLGTGREVPSYYEHVQTVQTEDGMVWHVFDRGPA